MIETTYKFTCDFKHRLLILAGWYGRGLEKGDVCSLADRIAEESEWNVCLKVTHLDLGLHGRVALYSADGNQIHQIGGQFGQLWYLALDEEYALLRIKSCGEIVKCHFYNVLANFLGIVGVVGQCLNVGHEDKHLVIVAFVLQLYAAT